MLMIVKGLDTPSSPGLLAISKAGIAQPKLVGKRIKHRRLDKIAQSHCQYQHFDEISMGNHQDILCGKADKYSNACLARALYSRKFSSSE